MSFDGLQSGFVVGAVIVAVLVSNRLGGGAGLAKRAVQAALGIVLMMLVLSGTTAFYGPPTFSDEELEAAFETDEDVLEISRSTARRVSVAGTIHLGVAVSFVVLGVALFRRLSVVTPALLLGGVLLLLLGVQTIDYSDPLSFWTALFGGPSGTPAGVLNDPGFARDTARFAVLLAGAAALSWLLCIHWKQHPPEDADEAAES